MRRRRIVENDWCCKFYMAYDESDLGVLLNALQRCGAPEDLLKKVTSNVLEGNLNEGFTFSDYENRCSVIGVGIADSGEQFLNSFVHELRHLVDDMAYADGLSPGGEETAYLTGNITLGVADIVCRYSCENCRQH